MALKGEKWEKERIAEHITGIVRITQGWLSMRWEIETISIMAKWVATDRDRPLIRSKRRLAQLTRSPEKRIALDTWSRDCEGGGWLVLQESEEPNNYSKEKIWLAVGAGDQLIAACLFQNIARRSYYKETEQVHLVQDNWITARELRDGYIVMAYTEASGEKQETPIIQGEAEVIRV